MRKAILVAATAALPAFAMPSFAQPMWATPDGVAPPAGTARPGVVLGQPVAQQTYLQLALSSDLFEIESSRMALERSRNPAVRRFASRMIGDHQRSSDLLIAHAGGPDAAPNTGAAVGGLATGALIGALAGGPVGAVVGGAIGGTAGAVTGSPIIIGGRPARTAGMHPAHEDMLRQLSILDGRDFDRAYVRMQVAAHREAVALHTGYAKSGEDFALRSAAAEIARRVRAHLSSAIGLARIIG